MSQKTNLNDFLNGIKLECSCYNGFTRKYVAGVSDEKYGFCVNRSTRKPCDDDASVRGKYGLQDFMQAIEHALN